MEVQPVLSPDIDTEDYPRRLSDVSCGVVDRVCELHEYNRAEEANQFASFFFRSCLPLGVRAGACCLLAHRGWDYGYLEMSQRAVAEVEEILSKDPTNQGAQKLLACAKKVLALAQHMKEDVEAGRQVIIEVTLPDAATRDQHYQETSASDELAEIERKLSLQAHRGGESISGLQALHRTLKADVDTLVIDSIEPKESKDWNGNGQRV